MGEELTMYPNDTSREIQQTMERLRAWDSPLCDQRVKAIMLTKLQEAWLFSLLLVTHHIEVFEG